VSFFGRLGELFSSAVERVQDFFSPKEEKEEAPDQSGDGDSGDNGAEEEEEEEFPDDFPDDWDLDVGDSDGGDESETEGYDYGSVSGYQIVIYY